MTLAVTVKHQRGDFAIDASFECGAGVTALFGRSGAGKTTLINAIAGLLKPREGRIEFDGETLLDTAHGIHVRAGRRGIGYVFQEGRLFPHLSVRQNLTYSWWFNARRRNDSHFEQVVALLGLAPLLKQMPVSLSGGEKQRVAIGRALLAVPRLLLLDEPLASLDAPRKAEILHYLQKLRDETRLPMVYVSHSVDEVLRLANYVVLMAHGRVVKAGPVEVVMGRPDTGASDSLFEGGTVIVARVSAVDTLDGMATLAFDGGELFVAHASAQVGEHVRVRIRAREVSLALEPPRNISIQNILQGNVDTLETSAAGVTVAVRVGAVLLRSRITLRAARQLGLQAGLPVVALVKAVALDRGQ